MVSRRTYGILGASATVFTFIAGILSLLVYIFKGRTDYLIYGIMWLLISILDYKVWRSPPETAHAGKASCSDLIAGLKLVRSLEATVGNEGKTDPALKTLVARLTDMKNAIRNSCGEKCLSDFENTLRGVNPELFHTVVAELEECIASHGCLDA
jgi:hypothetical protein